MRHILQRLFRPVHPAAAVLIGLGILATLHAARVKIDRRLNAEITLQNSLSMQQSALTQALERAQMENNLKHSDVDRARRGFSGQALSQKSLYESGLSLQEERRLLEKQLEIMTTYLQINPALQRVFLFRGGQPLESFLISYIPLKEFGGAPANLPPVVRIVSKERFAYPDRGQSQLVGGQLVWTPPQVGTSVRSNALGEFVVFTNSKLILHGPSVTPEDHEKFPHVCLGLSREAARQLYRDSFIGTKILLTPPANTDQ